MVFTSTHPPMPETNNRCCASAHEPPDTACRSFLSGLNTRCVYCDHEKKCHPGPGATCEIGSGESDVETVERKASFETDTAGQSL